MCMHCLECSPETCTQPKLEETLQKAYVRCLLFEGLYSYKYVRSFKEKPNSSHSLPLIFSARRSDS